MISTKSLAAFYVLSTPSPSFGSFLPPQIKPTANIPACVPDSDGEWMERKMEQNREHHDQKGENGLQEVEWVTGIERTRDWTIWVCLCFDCGPLSCICSLIRWEQLHCDWELAAWGIMRGSISAHRASKGKSADPLWWKIILMIGDLFCMPVLVKTLSLVHSLPLFLLVAHIAWKTLNLGSSVLDYLVLMCSDSMRRCRLNTFYFRIPSDEGAHSYVV